MKTVVLLRHGHAAELKDDHARPLTAEGRTAAAQAAAELQQLGIKPGAILSSTALRAVETAEIVAQVLECTEPIERQPQLYLASPERYTEAIQALDDRVTTAVLVAHNPGLGNLAKTWGHTGDMPPAGYYLVRRESDTWSSFELDE